MSKMTEFQRPLRLGMVGGGEGALIGETHRMAARLDHEFELVAGALSSTAEKATRSGAAIGLAEGRCYGDYREMAEREAALENGIEAVSIVVPNHLHLPVAEEFLKRGIHVICDKPLTGTLEEARKLKSVADQAHALFILTHNYTAYPMVREARLRIARGDLGALRLVRADYVQDWLSDVPAPDNKQADWRTDPARSGVGGSTGDIGTHAWNLLRFVTQLQPQAIAADLQSFVPGRALDDNAHVMLRFKGGERGMLWCSQVAAGEENNLSLKVYGTKASLEWCQQNPNHLTLTALGGARQVITRASAQTDPQSRRLTRLPPGHPEGFIEAFANLYKEAATAIRAYQAGTPLPPELCLPTIDDGVEGVAFVEACVNSSRNNSSWVSL